MQTRCMRLVFRGFQGFKVWGLPPPPPKKKKNKSFVVLRFWARGFEVKLKDSVIKGFRLKGLGFWV